MKKIILYLLIIGSGIIFFLTSSSSAHEAENSGMEAMKSLTVETHHLEVKPESLEGYRLPYMEVTVTALDQQTGQKQQVKLHPMFGGNFHYGANIALQPKTYLLSFHLDSPTFIRGHKREDQWLSPVDAEFTFNAAADFENSVKIGTKETSDMKILFEAEHAEEMLMPAGTKEDNVHGVEQSLQSVPSAPAARNKSPFAGALTLVAGVILGFVLARFLKRSPAS